MSTFPTKLRCEYCTNPIGVDQQNPRFSYVISTSQKSYLQSKYRIQLATEPEYILNDKPDMWDSGFVESSEQSGIAYQGKKLQPFTKYYWRVIVENNKGEVSAPSEISWFVTGIFKLHQWKADHFRPYNKPFLYTRHEFVIPENKKLKEAFIFIASQGSKKNAVSARLNGQQIGDDVQMPGPCEHYRMLYRGYDVTNLLNSGRNAIAILHTLTMSAIMRIVFDDLTDMYVKTDYNSWKTTNDGPYIPLEHYKGMDEGKAEEYDARKELTGWDMPGYDDSDWHSPFTEMWGIVWGPIVIKYQYVGCKVYEKIKPKTITKLENGDYFVDFGVNSSCYPVLKAQGKRGTTVEIILEELPNEDKTGLFHHSYPVPYVKYTFKGEGTEVYEPKFMHTSARYAIVKGFDQELTEDNISLYYIHSEVCNDSHFSCSNDDLNRIQSCAKRAFESNLIHIPTDCPGRERRGWTGDSFAVAEAELYNTDILRIYYKWFDDISDCQSGCGFIPVELPLMTDDNVDVNWPQNVSIIPWLVYNHTKDKYFLQKYFPILEKYINLLIDVSDDEYIVFERVASYGDWVSAHKASRSFLSTAYFYNSANIAAKISGVLGFDEKAAEYEKLAGLIKKSINRHFLHKTADSAYYDNNSQTSNATALYFDICPDKETNDKVLKSLIDDFNARGTTTTGFLGSFCIIPALAKNGFNEMAYNMLMNRNPGGWIWVINHMDATTMPENFDGGASQNHAFLGGSPSTWFFKYLCGIRPLEPGFSKIGIKPYFPPDLDSAKASVDTIHGIIVSEFNRIGNSIKLNVTIPANTTAVISLPIEYNIDSQGDDIILKDSCKTIEIGSGDYEFILNK